MNAETALLKMKSNVEYKCVFQTIPPYLFVLARIDLSEHKMLAFNTKLADGPPNFSPVDSSHFRAAVIRKEKGEVVLTGVSGTYSKEENIPNQQEVTSVFNQNNVDFIG